MRFSESDSAGSPRRNSVSRRSQKERQQRQLARKNHKVRWHRWLSCDQLEDRYALALTRIYSIGLTDNYTSITAALSDANV